MKTKRRLNVLVACESSATVRDAFRALGHNAWSCDLLPCDGDPRYHVQGDVFDLLQFGRPWRVPRNTKWDLLIGHPPCTYMCNSGVRWLTWRARPAMRMNWSEDRWKKMEDAVIFFSRLYTSDVPYIALENPIMHGHAKRLIGARLGVGNQQQSQIIQPWQFGHGETKATCLWLKNLPKLVPTDVVAGREHRVHKMPPGPNPLEGTQQDFRWNRTGDGPTVVGAHTRREAEGNQIEKLRAWKRRVVVWLLLQCGKSTFDFIQTWAPGENEPARVVHFARTERDFNIAVRQRVDALDEGTANE